MGQALTHTAKVAELLCWIWACGSTLEKYTTKSVTLEVVWAFTKFCIPLRARSDQIHVESTRKPLQQQTPAILDQNTRQDTQTEDRNGHGPNLKTASLRQKC